MVIDIERIQKVMYMSMSVNTPAAIRTYLLHDALKRIDCEELLNEIEESTTVNRLLTIRTSSIAGNNYKNITYKKNSVSPNTLTTLGLFRSVIFNVEDRIISFAPPKAMDYDEFKFINPDLSVLTIDEFIDGTMINVFHDVTLVTETGEDNSILGGGWHISTRKNIGATNHFYRYSNNAEQRDFGELFKETIAKAGVNIELLDTAYCYSFVMRHPENRIVSYVKEPELYLTDAFLLKNSLTDFIIPSPNKYKVTVASRKECREMSAFVNSDVKFPKEFIVHDYQELEKMVDDHFPDGTLTKGYMIHCPVTNLRTKIVTEEYNFVKELRGNFADLRLLFLTLCREGRVHEYLHYYPENYTMFAEYSHLLDDYIHCMYVLYRECFISKTKPLIEYPANFRTHMFKLHGLYKEYYQPKRGHIRHHDVVNYVNSLDIPLLFNTMFVAK
jgi:hypothetical protein